MLDYLIKLAQFMPEIGNVSSVSLYPDGFLTIDGTTPTGDTFTLSFRVAKENSNAASS